MVIEIAQVSEDSLTHLLQLYLIFYLSTEFKRRPAGLVELIQLLYYLTAKKKLT